MVNERKIIIGMITDTDYLRKVSTIYHPSYLESKGAKIIAHWCIQYFKKYGKAPGRDIEAIYTAELKGRLRGREEEAEWIANLLQSLSDEYEREGATNTSYLLDLTEQYFKERHITNLIDTVKGYLATGNLSEAEAEIVRYKSPTLPSISAVNPFELDDEQLREVFDTTELEPLIKFPGKLGQMINDQLTRDAFVAIMAPEKRGKTFWLTEFAFRASRNRKSVAFFQAGDLSQSQQLRRFYVYMTKAHYKKRYCGTVLMPVGDCWRSQTGTCSKCSNKRPIFRPSDNLDEEGNQTLKYPSFSQYCKVVEKRKDYVPCQKWRDGCDDFVPAVWYEVREVRHLTWGLAKEIKDKWAKHFAPILLSTHAAGTLTLDVIKAQLDIWEKQLNFTPDVIIIDYADLMVGTIHREFRHMQDEIWKGLRGLSQERRCLVVTATQADARSYDKETLSLSNFSEDKRKYSHVTAMFGLNQTPEEKEKGVMRVNQLVVRDDEFVITRCVHVLYSFVIGRAYLDSM